MSTLTDKFNLIVPERAEFPGEWDIPVNANWALIDQILKNVHINRASNSAPTTNVDDGSTWFDLATSLLKIRSSSAWKAVVAHTHDGSVEGVPKINLAIDILNDVLYRLPGNLVDPANLDADKIDGYHLAEIPAQIAGTGLEADTGKLAIAKISALETAAGGQPTIEFTKVTVDTRGRVLTGSKPSTVAGFGIGDVFTKLEIQANFAALKGNSAIFFQVKDPIDGSTDAGIPNIMKCAISREFADAKYATKTEMASAITPPDYTNIYHPKNGSITQSLVAQAPASDSSIYDNYVVTRLYSDTRYLRVGINHDAMHTTFLKLNGSLAMTGELRLSSTGAPVNDNGATSKLYVLNQIAGLSTSYASINGNKLNTFKVAKAPELPDVDWEFYALNKLRADEIYSPIHTHPYVTTAALSAAVSSEVALSISGAVEAHELVHHNPWRIVFEAETLNRGARIFADTSVAAFSITLPLDPVIGDTIEIVDLAGTFNTNNLTLLRNSQNIMGLAEDMIVNVNNASLKLVFSNATYGWRIV